MKIIIFSDLHMCPRSSIISKWGTKYPSRLENCIESLNWLERKAEELECNYVINLGDFFDRPDLSSETITACQDIQWSWLQHYHLVGNHDASSSSLIFNSVNCLSNDNHRIIAEPEMLELEDCEICFLPYVVECERKPLSEYFPPRYTDKHRIILSHNDISGIQLGPVVSRTGFSIEEIEANCDLWCNGHLHNGQAITPKVINLGNLTGKDFGENALKHSHNIAVLDTQTLSITYVENPHAYNFYKIQIDCESDILCLSQLKNNAVVSIKCESSLVDKVKQVVDELGGKITESRIILVKNYEEPAGDVSEVDLSVDHLARFVECCKANIEFTPLLEEEISEVCK